MTYIAHLPDGTSETLLSVPTLRFQLADHVSAGAAAPAPAGHRDRGHRALRQLDEQQVQSGSDAGCALGRSNVGRNDDRLLGHCGGSGVGAETVRGCADPSPRARRQRVDRRRLDGGDPAPAALAPHRSQAQFRPLRRRHCGVPGRLQVLRRPAAGRLRAGLHLGRQLPGGRLDPPADRDVHLRLSLPCQSWPAPGADAGPGGAGRRVSPRRVHPAEDSLSGPRPGARSSRPAPWARWCSVWRCSRC